MSINDNNNNKELTKEQQELLNRLLGEITNLATEVVLDYEINPPASGSNETVVQVHSESPVLKDNPPSESDGLSASSIDKDRKRWGG